MILELVIGQCVICGYESILFDDGEAYICVDRDTCSNHEHLKKEQTVYIGEHGPVRSHYYLEQARRGKR